MQDLTPEQIKIQEIQSLTAMPGWHHLVSDFEGLIKQYEGAIFDIEIPDTPTHSQKSIYIVTRNCLKTFIEKPERLISALTPIEK